MSAIDSRSTREKIEDENREVDLEEKEKRVHPTKVAKAGNVVANLKRALEKM